jgi:hypothetical protein
LELNPGFGVPDFASFVCIGRALSFALSERKRKSGIAQTQIAKKVAIYFHAATR